MRGPDPLAVAAKLAYEVGGMLARKQGSSIVVGHDDDAHPDGKGHHAIHTVEDETAEKFIRARLHEAFPLDTILGEENGLTQGTSEYTWVFDPIDGTSQYAAGLPADWCVAIGRWRRTVQDLAVVYVPGTKELFFGERGLGAWIDSGDGEEKRRVDLRASSETSLSKVVGSFGVDMLHLDQYMDSGVLKRLSKTVRTMRVVRSGDHELSHLAAGRIGMLYNHAQKPWDCIPLLLVEEAGGCWTRYDEKHAGLVELPHRIRPSTDERVSYLACGNEELLCATREILKG